MEKLYYDPETGYGGVEDLIRKSGLPRQEVVDFLQKQDVYTVHKPIIRKFTKRRVYTSGIHDQFQADLVDMQAHKNKNKFHRYILTIIDCFSKYAWAIPIKRKQASDMSVAFDTFFKTLKRLPNKLQTDSGLEFKNRQTRDVFKKYKVHWFASQNKEKAQIVERFQRSLKERMYKYFTANGTVKWIDVLDKLIKNYNNSYHRSIKMTPSEANQEKNEELVHTNLYGERTVKKEKPQYKPGDLVRISKYEKDFRKGYLPHFTNEIFYVDRVLDTRPPTYKLKDEKEEEVYGAFYKQELSKVQGSG